MPNNNGPGYGENIGRNPAPGPSRAQRFFGDPRFAALIEAFAPLLISKLGGGPDMGYGAMQGIQGVQENRRLLGQDQLRRQEAEREQAYRQEGLENERRRLKLAEQGAAEGARKERAGRVSKALADFRAGFALTDPSDAQALTSLADSVTHGLDQVLKRNCQRASGNAALLR